MAALGVKLMGHPALRRRSAPVTAAVDLDVGRLVADMIETMHRCGGVGLAAPQVGLNYRLIVFMVPPSRMEEGESPPPDGVCCLLNPVIDPIGEEMQDGLEGCLSIPGLRGIVPRHASIRYRGTDAEGTVIDRMAQGFHARVVQHEIDHLDGVLYPDRMRDLTSLAFESEIAARQGEGMPT